MLEALNEIGQNLLNGPEFQHTVQRESEMPDAFWVHLLEVGVDFAYLDVNNPKDKQILASAFIDQLANDIWDHFHQIVSNWSSLEISELCRITKFVFDQRERLREEEKEKKEAEKERERDRKRRTERMEDLKMFAAMRNDRRCPNPPPSDNQPRCPWYEETGELGMRYFRCGRRGNLKRACRENFPGPRSYFLPLRASFPKGSTTSNGRENPRLPHHIQFEYGLGTL